MPTGRTISGQSASGAGKGVEPYPPGMEDFPMIGQPGSVGKFNKASKTGARPTGKNRTRNPRDMLISAANKRLQGP